MKATTKKRERICDAFNKIKRKCIKNYLPIEEQWIPYKEGFNNFYNYIIKKYNKAEKKWKNYTQVSPKRAGKQSTRSPGPICIGLKIKDKGLIKQNILITNHSDIQKPRHNTYKIMFENKLLSTRDIHNILKKRGIDISLETITKRIRQQNKIFALKDKHKIKYQGKFMSSCEIERINNIHKGTLKGYLKRHTFEEAKQFYNLK